jgi:hypothetical protein
MKITKQQLRKIILEEIHSMYEETLDPQSSDGLGDDSIIQVLRSDFGEEKLLEWANMHDEATANKITFSRMQYDSPVLARLEGDRLIVDITLNFLPEV